MAMGIQYNLKSYLLLASIRYTIASASAHTYGTPPENNVRAEPAGNDAAVNVDENRQQIFAPSTRLITSNAVKNNVEGRQAEAKKVKNPVAW